MEYPFICDCIGLMFLRKTWTFLPISDSLVNHLFFFILIITTIFSYFFQLMLCTTFQYFHIFPSLSYNNYTVNKLATIEIEMSSWLCGENPFLSAYLRTLVKNLKCFISFLITAIPPPDSLLLEDHCVSCNLQSAVFVHQSPYGTPNSVLPLCRHFLYRKKTALQQQNTPMCPAPNNAFTKFAKWNIENVCMVRTLLCTSWQMTRVWFHW
jgi:hypothetical protein